MSGAKSELLHTSIPKFILNQTRGVIAVVRTSLENLVEMLTPSEYGGFLT